jgi:peptidoglycan/LPS O-acetylase OafA/YrhL
MQLTSALHSIKSIIGPGETSARDLSRPISSTGSPAYRPDIDGLRAVAILSVLVFHAFPSLLPGGFVGVDIFFVISGYLISDIIVRRLELGRFGFCGFYARRVKRIFPSLIVVLSATLILGSILLPPVQLEKLGKHTVASAGFFENYVLLWESGYFDVTSDLKPLKHIWSLALEEQFYLIYPLLLWMAWKRGRGSAIGFMALLGVLSFGINISGVEEDLVKTFLNLPARFWEFLGGASLSYARLSSTSWVQGIRARSSVANHGLAALQGIARPLLSWGGVLVLCLSALLMNQRLFYPGWWALLVVLGTVAVVAAGPETWVNRVVLGSRFMVLIGLISYPLYLWHWPLLTLARILESGTPSPESRLVALLLSVLLATLTYSFIEKPIRSKRKISRLLTLVLLVALTLVGILGYTVAYRAKLQIQAQAESKDVFNWGWTSSDPACMKAYPAFAKHYCLLSNPVKEPTVMLLGDSHSNHLYPGLVKALKSTEEVVLNLGIAGCPPFSGLASFQKGERDVCLDTAKKALEVATTSKQVKMVILSSRGPLYFTGRGFGDGASEDRKLSLIDSPEITDFRTVYEIAMRKTLSDLVKSEKEIVFVLGAPELGFYPESCVNSRIVWFTKSVREPCAVSKKEFVYRNREYREVVARVLKDFPRVRVFDASERLCDSDWCWGMKDGQMFYRDDSHLSVVGSEYVAKGLLPLIKKVAPAAKLD